jgi:hypothetical protein
MSALLHVLMTIGAILLALLIYVVVQRSYRLFSKQHPELGPFRVEGKGCGACADDNSCSGGSCSKS